MFATTYSQQKTQYTSKNEKYLKITKIQKITRGWLLEKNKKQNNNFSPMKNGLIM